MTKEKKTDILTGRIVQRIIDIAASRSGASDISVVHGVSNEHDIGQLLDNLFRLFSDSTISLKRLAFGYELNIKVKF